MMNKEKYVDILKEDKPSTLYIEKNIIKNNHVILNKDRNIIKTVDNNFEYKNECYQKDYKNDIIDKGNVYDKYINNNNNNNEGTKKNCLRYDRFHIYDDKIKNIDDINETIKMKEEKIIIPLHTFDEKKTNNMDLKISNNDIYNNMNPCNDNIKNDILEVNIEKEKRNVMNEKGNNFVNNKMGIDNIEGEHKDGIISPNNYIKLKNINENDKINNNDRINNNDKINNNDNINNKKKSSKRTGIPLNERKYYRILAKQMKKIQGLTFDHNQIRWIAYWKNENNKQIQKHFPVCKFGFHEARQLALEFRNLKINDKNKNSNQKNKNINNNNNMNNNNVNNNNVNNNNVKNNNVNNNNVNNNNGNYIKKKR
ncbi:hypothetical protein PFMG_03229 [Plasmodium falciparum IGH-CR14]|uniref:AP2/ERF domain-containing protein n=1 Tax=Plasmodium falciparum IGH-CR14 TaxID=580059 RepID=A0A0L1ICR4_PLAFA|nr:hypothetical protein PFMG_03229 [Plasmodium falciparum IGH-CR14]